MTEQQAKPVSSVELTNIIKELVSMPDGQHTLLTRQRLLYRLINEGDVPDTIPSPYAIAAKEPRDLDVNGMTVFKAIEAHSTHPSMQALEELYESETLSDIKEKEELNRLERATGILLQYTVVHDI